MPTILRNKFSAVVLFFASTTVVGITACVGDEPGADGVASQQGGDGGSQSSGNGGDGSPNNPQGDGGNASQDGSSSGGDSGLPSCGVPNTACCSGNVCSGGALCNGTICACPQGQTACGAACVDTTKDQANCGRCNHDCFGGTCSAGVCGAYTVTQSQPLVARMVVNADRLYWSRRINNPAPGGFFSSKLDGTDLVTIYPAGTYTDATGAHANTCTGAAIGIGKAYFLCQTGVVASVLISGAKDQVFDLRECTLPCTAGGSTVKKSGIINASNVATDPVTGIPYYSIYTPYAAAPSGAVFDGSGNAVGAANQPNTSDIAVANGSVYWLNGGTYDSAGQQAFFNGGVRRASLTALSTEITIVGAGSKYQDMSSLAVDANNVYYASASRDIIVAGIGAVGAAPSVFSLGAGAAVGTDGTNVFFDDFVGNSIVYCPRAAGCAGVAGRHTLSSNEAAIVALTVATDSIIWARYDGVIRRAAKP